MPERLTIEIDAKTLAGVRQSFGKLDQSLARVNRDLRKTGKTAKSINLRKPFNEGHAAITKLGPAMRKVTLGLTALGVAGAAAMALLTRKSVMLGQEFREVEMAFTVMLRSGDKAKRLFADLQTFAAKTTFNFRDVAQAATQLLAFGFEGDKIVDTLVKIADAGALGREKFMSIVRAIGQIRTAGTVMGQELLQLTNAGIPAYEILADKLNLTAKEVKNIGTMGISSQEAIAALLEGMEERYAGLQAAMNKTFGGQMSNLVDNIEKNLGEMGKAIGDELLPILKELNAAFDDLTEEDKAKFFRDVASLTGFMAENLVKFAKSMKVLPSLFSKLGKWGLLPEPWNTGMKLYKHFKKPKPLPKPKVIPEEWIVPLPSPAGVTTLEERKPLDIQIGPRPRTGGLDPSGEPRFVFGTDGTRYPNPRHKPPTPTVERKYRKSPFEQEAFQRRLVQQHQLEGELRLRRETQRVMQGALAIGLQNNVREEERIRLAKQSAKATKDVISAELALLDVRILLLSQQLREERDVKLGVATKEDLERQADLAREILGLRQKQSNLEVAKGISQATIEYDPVAIRFDRISENFEDSLANAIAQGGEKGAKTLQQAFKRVINDIKLQFARAIVKRTIGPMIQQVLGRVGRADYLRGGGGGGGGGGGMGDV